MIKKVEETFKSSYLNGFETFEDVVNSKDISTFIGLRELLEKLTVDSIDENKSK